jgi:hypothetical protein
MTGLKRARGLCLAAAMLCLALALPAAGLAAATVTYVPESKQAFEAQLNKGEIASATFNKRLRSLRIDLKSGEHFLYKYPKKGSPALEAQLKARKVSVTVLSPTQATKEVKPAKHKLRYIAGGILIVIILVVGIVLLVNRRRQPSE